MQKTVILANGVFPKKGGTAWKLLESARRVIACDGAADVFLRRFRRAPDYIVGDLDSIKVKRKGEKVKRKGEKGKSKSEKGKSVEGFHLIHVKDQSTNDLSKAIAFCRSKGWRNLVIVGATGKREDHALGNIFRAMEAGIEIVTDCGRFLPFEKRLRLRVGKGAAVSVFASDRRTRMTSRGLAWPLDGVRFDNLYCATLNHATAAMIELTADRPSFLYVGIRKNLI